MRQIHLIKSNFADINLALFKWRLFNCTIAYVTWDERMPFYQSRWPVKSATSVENTGLESERSRILSQDEHSFLELSGK